MPYYESDKSMITIACYKSGNDNDKSDNNEDKICLLLKRWDLVNHLLDHILNHVLDHMLNHMIIGLVTIAL